MKISTKQYAKMMKHMADGALKKAVIRGIRSGALRALPALVSTTDTSGAVDRGRFRQSWKTQALPDGVSVLNSAPYSGVIEYGRRPGRRQPPTKALVPWVQRKLGVDESMAKSVAYTVARAIGRKGTKGKFILKRTIATIIKYIDIEVKHELQKAAGGTP